MNGCKRACLPISIQPSCRDDLLAGEVIKAWRELSSRRKPQPSWNAGQHESRDTKSQNFSVGRISRAKTFRMECVNRVRDIYAPKVRKSTLSRKYPYSMETLQTVWKVSAKAIYALLAHICHESNLRTFGAYMSGIRITHSIRKVFAREILPTGKF